jgi:hypothetical protein
MCIDQYEHCPYCRFERHIHWVWCQPYVVNLVDHMKKFREPLPKPDHCPSLSREKKRILGILSCPVDNCLTTELAPAKLAEIERKHAAIRAAHHRAWEKAEAKRKRFASKWFKKRPIVLPSTRSLLTEGIKWIESVPHVLVYTDPSLEFADDPNTQFDMQPVFEPGTWFSPFQFSQK